MAGVRVPILAHAQGFGLDRHVPLVSLRHRRIGTSYGEIFVQLLVHRDVLMVAGVQVPTLAHVRDGGRDQIAILVSISARSFQTILH